MVRAKCRPNNRYHLSFARRPSVEILAPEAAASAARGVDGAGGGLTGWFAESLNLGGQIRALGPLRLVPGISAGVGSKAFCGMTRG